MQRTAAPEKTHSKPPPKYKPGTLSAYILNDNDDDLPDYMDEAGRLQDMLAEPNDSGNNAAFPIRTRDSGTETAKSKRKDRLLLQGRY